jgi:hypothetical protein
MTLSRLLSALRLTLAAGLLGSLSLGVSSLRAEGTTGGSCASCCDNASAPAKKKDKKGKKHKKADGDDAAAAATPAGSPAAN